jgi:hypothetical protein
MLKLKHKSKVRTVRYVYLEGTQLVSNLVLTDVFLGYLKYFRKNFEHTTTTSFHIPPLSVVTFKASHI